MGTEVYVNGASDYLTPVGASKLGTLVFDNIFFPGGEKNKWTDINGNSQIYSDFKLDSVTFRVSRRKDIVKTQRAGANGKFKEYISFDDFNIDCSAILAPDVNSPEKEPIKELNDFAKLEKAEVAVPIRSKILNNTFNITKVVIEEFNISRVGSDSWKLDMLLISDLPIDFGAFG